MTVEEALLALLAAVAIVLLFLGLADALEGDARARLRAGRRSLARRAPHSRAAAEAARGPRPALTRRPASEPRAVEAPGAAVSAPPEDTPEWRNQAAALMRGREWVEARRVVESALAAREAHPESVAFFHSTVIGCAVLQLARDNPEARAEAKAVLKKAAACITKAGK